ncbi:MAG: hypothetical protein KJZ70_06450 [Bryobacterales bacterium]|nr:hypothetical protein [Bryobacterales bacterium]
MLTIRVALGLHARSFNSPDTGTLPVATLSCRGIRFGPGISGWEFPHATNTKEEIPLAIRQPERL